MKSITYAGAVCEVFWWVWATENEETRLLRFAAAHLETLFPIPILNLHKKGTSDGHDRCVATQMPSAISVFTFSDIRP